MTARFPDNNGFVLSLFYTQADIPADQAPALKAAVAAIAGMDEDWQAVQVWVRCNWVFQAPTGDADNYQSTEAVILTVEAINADGGRRTFTASDYPEFIITDSAAVSFFKYFTTTNQ